MRHETPALFQRASWQWRSDRELQHAAWLRESIVLESKRIPGPFPPAVANRLLLSALTVAIE